MGWLFVCVYFGDPVAVRLDEGLCVGVVHSEALAVDDVGTILVVLLLRDPHRLES